MSKLKWIAVTMMLAFSVAGCESAYLEGLATGIGAAAGSEEMQNLSNESKTALALEIIQLRTAADAAMTAEERQALEAQLAAAEKKQLVSDVSTTVTEGLQRDWTSKDADTQKDNLIWAATVALPSVFGANEFRKRRKLDKGVQKLERDSEPSEAARIHSAVNGGGVT